MNKLNANGLVQLEVYHMVQNTPKWDAKEYTRLQNKTQLNKKSLISFLFYFSQSGVLSRAFVLMSDYIPRDV